MKSPTIKTPNYTLRPFKTEDATLWQVWDIDPEVQAHMPEPKNTPQDISEQYTYIEECEQDPEGYYFSIETNSGVTIGTVSLFEINLHHKTAELGIVIGDKTYWGKGVATEVVKALVNYASQNLSIQYISAEIESGNSGMQKVLENSGFVSDGVFKGARVKDGKRTDVVHFSRASSPSTL